jgi:hypothetical protein
VSVPPRTTFAAGAVDELAVVAVLDELETGDPEDGEADVPPEDWVAVELDVVVVDELEAAVDVLLLPPLQAASSVEIAPPAIARPPTTPARLRKRRRDNPAGIKAFDSTFWL